MKLAIALFTVLQLCFVSAERELTKEKERKGKCLRDELPEIGYLMDTAFTMWEVDRNGRRKTRKPCRVDSCEWNPFYLTKRYDGLHPDYGGHPTDIDVGYAFYYASPFGGQPGGGSPHHCKESDDPVSTQIQKCPKIVTLDDNGPSGPGHIPPHIALASLTWAVRDCLVSVEDMFHYDRYGCRVIPDVLFDMIRHYYPRTEGEPVDYPPPFTPEGGDYQYEFPSGRGIRKQRPPYEPGPPHWCTDEFIETDNWADFCPYIFKGPDAGKYRHPHIAYAALEVYLANIAMPRKCATTWLENNPDYLDPERTPTNIAFPDMDSDDRSITSIKNWKGQPVLPYSYPNADGYENGNQKKDAAGVYVNEYFLSE